MIPLAASSSGNSVSPVATIGLPNGPVDSDVHVRSGAVFVSSAQPLALVLTIEDAADNVLFGLALSLASYQNHNSTILLVGGVVETRVTMGSLVQFSRQLGFGAPDHFAVRANCAVAGPWTAGLALELE